MINLSEDFILSIIKELEPIIQKMEKYKKDSQDYKLHLSLNAKSLGEVNKEQPAYYAYYDERRAELYYLLQLTEAIVESVKAKLWHILQKNNQYSASKTDLEYEVKNNNNYNDFLKIQLEVNEVYELYKSIVKSFEQRGYSLKNLTEIRVHGLENDIL